MVIEVLSKKPQGGLGYALDFIAESFVASKRSLEHPLARGPRPWCIVEVDTRCRLYLPGLPRPIKEHAARGLMRWIQCSEALAPSLCQMLLESGLCAGVFLVGHEVFARSTPAALWGRRWQLAAKEGECDFIWLHENPQALIGFDVRLEWTGAETFEIKRGHGYLNKNGVQSDKVAQSTAA